MLSQKSLIKDFASVRNANVTEFEMATKTLLPKPMWQKAVGIARKPRRLSLQRNLNGKYSCPVVFCDSEPFASKRGCRKHVFFKHGWYYFFNEKPNVFDYFPELSTKLSIEKCGKKCTTSSMPSFSTNCVMAKSFGNWLQSPGGGGKCSSQSNQLATKVMKFLKFCCADIDSSWEITESVTDYCIGSLGLISDFVHYLQHSWKVGFSGVIGYMNALSHMLDFRRSVALRNENISVFVSSEIYLERVKKCLKKRMKSEWSVVLSVEYLSSINCWASLDDLQSVIPYHANKFTQILINCGNGEAVVPSHDLSFCTAFIVTVLFILVKGSRPMTYKFLTLEMITSLGKNGGIIDQTKFKTSEKYGFDSLIFTSQILDIINGYIKCVRPRLRPVCDYLLITRNGTQLTQLSSIFGRMVFLAIGKYIHPTRYRQIIETESAAQLTNDEQTILSRDQKHSSNVARVHYQKLESRHVAEKGAECMSKLVNRQESDNAIENVNKTITSSINIEEKSDETIDFNNVSQDRQKRTTFSSIEDDFLRQGIKKYGKGVWTKLLKDETLKFHPTRRPSSLYLRAKVLKLL